MKLDNRDDVVRAFWALLIGSKVAADGQIKGLRDWHRAITPLAATEAERIAEWCWVKIERGYDDPEACILAGVRLARERIAAIWPDAESQRPAVSDVARLVNTICQGLPSVPEPRKRRAFTPDPDSPGWFPTQTQIDVAKRLAAEDLARETHEHRT